MNKEKIKEIDYVIPIPDTSKPVALAVSKILNIPYYEAITKNRYVNRTFIMNTQEKRKLNVLQAHLQYNGNNVTEIVKNNLFKFTFLPSKVNLLDYTSEQQINKKLAKWLLKNANNKKININIIEVDNYKPELIKTIININRIKANNMNNVPFSMQKD